jgi:hypothetical protein
MEKASGGSFVVRTRKAAEDEGRRPVRLDMIPFRDFFSFAPRSVTLLRHRPRGRIHGPQDGRRQRLGAAALFGGAGTHVDLWFD